MDTVFYLVRHGEPAFAQNKRVCLGCRSNPPLSDWGREQAKAVARFLPEDIPVYCSPLLRSRETALYLSSQPQAMEDLTECDMGPWDGLDFETIRNCYPDLYAQRRNNHALLPRGAESYMHAAIRMLLALKSIRHDAVIVGHAGALRALLCQLMKVDFAQNRNIPMPYGSISQVIRNEQGEYKVEFVGRMPQLYPSDEEISKMYLKQGTPEPVIAHCDAVASFALELAESVGQINCRLLYTSAKLHDLCRGLPDHAVKGAQVLRMQGYPEIARIVEIHHSPIVAQGRIDEAALLFYADKRVQESGRVSLKERFDWSLTKCRTPEARQAHEQQRRAAERIERMIRSAGCLL